MPTRFHLTISAAAFTCLVALNACSPRERGPAMSVTDSAGVPIIVNDPDRPVWRREDAWRLAPQPAVQVGNISGDPGHTLYGVEHSARLPDGGILVANTGLGELRIYDAQGTYVRTVTLPESLSSDGPVQPMYVVPLPGDSVLVALADGSLAVMSPIGLLARRVPPPPARDGVMEQVPAGVFGDGTLLMRGALPFDTLQPGLRRHPWRFFRSTGERNGEVTMGDFGLKPEIVGEGVLVFSPDAQWATADSTLWYGDAERFEIREVAPGGRTLRIIRLNQEPPPVTATDTMTFRHGAITQLEGVSTPDSALAVVNEYRYPTTFPTYDRLVVDELGNVWVRQYGWFDLGGDKTWTVFASDGQYLGELSTPSLLEIHHIGADYVLGHMAASRGKEAVYIWPLVKPQPAP